MQVLETVLEKKGKRCGTGKQSKQVQIIHAVTELRKRDVKVTIGDNKGVDSLKVRSRAVKEVKRTREKGEVMNNKSGAKRSELVQG